MNLSPNLSLYLQCFRTINQDQSCIKMEHCWKARLSFKILAIMYICQDCICEYQKAQFLSHGRGLFFSHKKKLRSRGSKDGVTFHSSPRNQDPFIFLFQQCQHVAFILMRARWLLQLQALSAYPRQESKSLLVKLWLLFGKENPLLGLFICLFLAKLPPLATRDLEVCTVSSLPCRKKAGEKWIRMGCK